MKLKSSLTRFSVLTFHLIFFLLISLPVAHAQIEIKNQIPKKVPLKIEFKNYDSERWVHDLEIVVTNTSTKPIYYLFLNLGLDVKADNGSNYGFPFFFGNGNLYGSIDTKAGPDDEFIAPGEVYTFRIEAKFAEAWDYRKTNSLTAPFYVEPRNAEFELGWISFGDGTGFQGGGTPFKKKR